MNLSSRISLTQYESTPYLLSLDGSSKGSGHTDGCRGPVSDHAAVLKTYCISTYHRISLKPQQGLESIRDLRSPVGWRRGNVVVEGSSRSPGSTVRRPCNQSVVSSVVCPRVPPWWCQLSFVTPAVMFAHARVHEQLTLTRETASNSVRES